MKFWLLLMGILAGILAMLGWAIWGLPDGLLHVWVMDVGQGDAILIESGVGERILIDGGPDSTVLKRLGEILPFYEDSIDLIILSHPHADHINGLVDVLQRFRVRAVLMTGVKYNYGTYDEFYRRAAERGVQVFYTDGTEDLRLGKMGIDLVYPEKSLQGESFNNVNNSSIVFRLIYGKRRLLFSGDLEMEKEAELVKVNGLQLGADFLKAGHHGSKTSNTEEWVSRVKP
jgi:competence protein ComEC